MKKNLNSGKKRELKKPVNKPKKKTRSQLVKILDVVFSQYIRLRDADSVGIVTCPLCGTKKHRKEMQNMHFISRACYALRRNEENCHAGCYRCNVVMKGNYIEYTLFIMDRFGVKKLDQFKEIKSQIFKIHTREIEQEIELYRLKIYKLSQYKKV